MATAQPFTWTVTFTVHPMWVQDGFFLTDERALNMLSGDLAHAEMGTELQAKVVNAPSAQQIASMQGYTKKHPEIKQTLQEIKAGSPHDGVLSAALKKARDLLDSVAFVAKEGDTQPVLAKLDEAIALIASRQGEAEEIES